MGRVVKIPSSNVSEYRLNLDDFSGGTNTVISQARLGKRERNNKYAVESVNLVQDQDGIWRTKPGLKYYGTGISSIPSIDGCTEFTNGSTRELIAVGGGSAWKSTDDAVTWSQISGASFTSGYKPAFLEIDDKLYISNRQDALAVYDGTSLTTYSSLSDPGSAPTATRGAGLSAGSYTYYYYFTANNSIGNTNPSPAGSVTTNKPYTEWDATSNEYVDISFSAVTGANSYDIWMGETSGVGYYLGRTTGTSWRHTGQHYNAYQELPDDNTTQAPKMGSLEVSNNRIWGTYDPDNPYRVYASGTGQYLGYFSPFYGGMWIDLEKGGKYTPVSVVHYRTGKGDSIATVLCSSPDGQGTIFQIELTTITVGDETFTVPIAYKLVGSIGADSPYAVVKVSDNVFFSNVRGVHVLKNKESMFNVLATDDETSNVRDNWEGLNQSKISNVVSYYKAPRLYWSVPIGNKNDTTIVFDMERRNWNWGWTVGFNGFLEHTDVNDNTNLLAIPTSGNKLVEISDSYQNDLGSAFLQKYTSPLMPVNHKRHSDKAKIKHAIFEVSNLKGNVNFKVLGVQKDGQIEALGIETLISATGNAGISDDAFSDFMLSDATYAPTVFAQKTQKKVVKVNKKLYDVQFQVSSTEKNTYFELLSIQAEGFMLPGRPPSNWR